MKNFSFKAIIGALAGAVLSLAFVAQAYAIAPSLSLYSTGNNIIQITVYGDANASVILDYYSGGQLLGAGVIGTTDYSGHFSTSINASYYSIPSSAQVIVMINGQQSIPATWPATGTNVYNPCVVVCGTVTTPTLSQTSVSLAIGQSQVVSITNPYNYNYNYGYLNTAQQYYIPNNTNSVVNASINGNNITLYGVTSGSTTLTICSNGSYGLSNQYNNGCATLYVTVGVGNNYYYPPTTYYPPTNYYYPPTTYYNNTPLTVSNSDVQVTIGNVGTVVLYGNTNYDPYGTNNGYNQNNYYVTSNNNGIANAMVNGNTLTITGTSAGSTIVTVCQTGTNQCANVNVTVINPTYYNYGYYNGQYQYTPSQNGQYYYGNHSWHHR